MPRYKPASLSVPVSWIYRHNNYSFHCSKTYRRTVEYKFIPQQNIKENMIFTSIYHYTLLIIRCEWQTEDMWDKHFSMNNLITNKVSLSIFQFKLYRHWKAFIHFRKILSEHKNVCIAKVCNICCFNLLQLVFSACVAAVKCRPVLHHCVVKFV